jgi:hypothetical protein
MFRLLLNEYVRSAANCEVERLKQGFEGSHAQEQRTAAARDLFQYVTHKLGLPV